MYKNTFYLIETITNTHVGSGEENMGVIDNMIQKDPITKIPVFHGQSIKGALKHFCAESDGVYKDKEYIRHIFGDEDSRMSEKDQSTEKVYFSKTNKGHVVFNEARLLFLPVRASNKMFYYATSPDILLDFFNMMKRLLNSTDFDSIIAEMGSFHIPPNEVRIFNDYGQEFVENYETENDTHVEHLKLVKSICEWLDVKIENVALFNSKLLSVFCDIQLPIIARNKLKEDGTSDNLFYEEVLPRKTILWTFFSEMANLDTNDFNKFKTMLNDELFQLGANETVGYGLCKFGLVKESAK